jgi:broad specificity phosphatase PhoE
VDEQRIVAYFVRHGETQLNAEGRFRGPTDVPLSTKGIHDAEALATYFSHIKLGDAYTSSKQRAIHTSELVLEGKGMSAAPTDKLHAWNVGHLAGEKKSDHKDDVEYFQKNPSLPLPGGESLDEFRDRVNPAIKKALLSGVKNGVPSITFAHSSIIHQLNHLVHHNHTRQLVEPGGVAAVYYNGKKFHVQALIKKEAPEEAKNAL